MKIATRWVAVAVIVSLVVMTGKVWAQEEAQAKTPRQVVSEFSDALLFETKPTDLIPLQEHVTGESGEALDRWSYRLIEPLRMWLILPRLVPEQPIIDGETATVAARPQPRSLEVKLVKEEGQWKVDLLGTIAGLPEPFAVTVEELEAQVAGSPQAPAPQPESSVETPAEGVDEEEQPSSVVEITLDNFKEEVLEAGTPVLLEFWQPGCEECEDLKPVFDKAALDYTGKVKFASVNANSNLALAIAFELVRVPCLVLVQGDDELGRTVGYMNEQQLKDWIGNNLGAQQ